MTVSTASVIACFRYKDAPAAIEWLCKAFGFERHLVVPDEKGGVAHAELKLKPPVEGKSSVVTSTMYVVVTDVEEHFRRADAAGATVIKPPTAQDFGGSNYSCRDPEGYVWTFGDYDPFKPPK